MKGKVLGGILLILIVGSAWGELLDEPVQISAISSQDPFIQIDRTVAVRKQLENALRAKGDAYIPRTQHLDSRGRPHYTNRLILEDSPYLLQHAHNPVDWHAWGPEAFAKAKRENKPIFLSIGYSTCHWCHVMEQESFENPQIALWLNKYFVPIKVDRERRPDVDATYMTAVVLISGQGGWPMSSFLSPEGKTFFAGTYFPPAEFTRLIHRIDSLWRENRSEFLTQADRVAQAVIEVSAMREKGAKLEVNTIQKGVAKIMLAYDTRDGGYSQAPKFPNEPLLYLLLNHVEHSLDKEVLSSLQYTLGMMSQGGIYDQIGGGFHRYSTDDQWLVPHFEKMLYTQANLSRIYLRGWKLTGKRELERVARHTLDYVLRQMTAPQGGFYSATDADSEGREGWFFLWTPEQIKAVLNRDDAKLALDLYQLSENGDFEGRNILHIAQSLEVYAASHQLDPDIFIDQIARINRRLLEKRQQRIPPDLDIKIITAWNAMMITALAQAGDMLHETDYVTAAIRAAEFIWLHNRKDNGELWRASLNGHASVAASQEDYAYLAESFLMLFDVTGQQRWLQRAEILADTMLKLFWDKDSGGFFMGTQASGLGGMGRIKESSEGAIPAGNSVALHVLQKLNRRTDNLQYGQYAEATLAAFSSILTSNPTTFPYMLSAANDLFNGETGAHQYAARGAVTVDAEMDTGQNLTLSLSIRPGWHINAHQPLQDYLIPTNLRLTPDASGWRIKHVDYPAAKLRSLGFQQEQLSLYEGEVKLNVTLIKMEEALFASALPSIELQLQACSFTVCLPPEKLRLVP